MVTRRNLGIFILAMTGVWQRVSPVTICPPTLDLVFIVDSSGSIGNDAEQNYGLMLGFMTQIVDRLQIGRDGVRVAVVTFSTQSVIHWELNSTKTYSRETLKEHIVDLEYQGKGTYTYRALEDAADIFDRGDRSGVENLAMLVTDGKSTFGSLSTLQKSARKLKARTRVVAVGVTSDIDREELETIATSNCDIFTIDDFYVSSHDLEKVMDLLCRCPPGYIVNECDCDQCPQGTFQPAWNELKCQDCEQGTITLHMASPLCVEPCPPGSFHFNSTTSQCILCPPSTYQPQQGTDACINCPNGTRSFTTGNIDQSSCSDNPAVDPLSSPMGDGGNGNSAVVIAAAIIGVLLLILLVLIAAILYRRWAKRKAEAGSGTTWLDNALHSREAGTSAGGGGGAVGFLGLFGKKKSMVEELVPAKGREQDHTYVGDNSAPATSFEDIYENPDVGYKGKGKAPKTKPKPGKTQQPAASRDESATSYTPASVHSYDYPKPAPAHTDEPIYSNQPVAKETGHRRAPPPLPTTAHDNHEEPIYDNETYEEDYENVTGYCKARKI